MDWPARFPLALEPVGCHEERCKIMSSCKEQSGLQVLKCSRLTGCLTRGCYLRLISTCSCPRITFSYQAAQMGNAEWSPGYWNGMGKVPSVQRR
eukprot:488551-Pelagomonas_calceolata.AAC.4